MGIVGEFENAGDDEIKTINTVHGVGQHGQLRHYVFPNVRTTHFLARDIIEY
jgi:hypothetical protein